MDVSSYPTLLGGVGELPDTVLKSNGVLPSKAPSMNEGLTSKHPNYDVRLKSIGIFSLI